MPSRSPTQIQHRAVKSAGGGLTYVLRQCLTAEVSLPPAIFVALPGRGHPGFHATERISSSPFPVKLETYWLYTKLYGQIIYVPECVCICATGYAKGRLPRCAPARHKHSL